MSGSQARFEYQEDLRNKHMLTRQDTLTSFPTAKTLREYITAIDIDQTPPVVRGNGIICTIGPACQTVEQLKELIANGMNIARMNFSHGDHKYHQQIVDNVRAAALDALPHPVGIALDTKGPEIRTGNLKDGGTVSYKKDQALKVSCDPTFKDICDINQQYLEYPSLTKSLKVGSKIFIADGLLALTVNGILDDKTIMTSVANDATIGSRKNCNLPGAIIDLPAVSEKDKGDLLFGVKNKVDMVFASFIRKRQDVLDVREALGPDGKDIKIISKIENHEGIVNIDEILRVTDGVMVARGDMGMEIPLEKVFLAQKMIIARASRANKPVICATQMLESMIKNPRPTRAEITDVGNAVVDGADCVMLSGETASGSYPIEAVAMMHKICREASTAVFQRIIFDELKNAKPTTDATETTAIAAVSASFKVNAAAIIVLTTTGRTAWILSHYQPRCPVIVVTRDAHIARCAHLYKGLFPLAYPYDRKEKWAEDMDARLEFAIEKGRDMGFIKKGSYIIFVSGWQPGSQQTNTLSVLQVQEEKQLLGRFQSDITFPQK